MMLLSRAKSGAKGNDATNSVTNPNWITAHNNNKHYTELQMTASWGHWTAECLWCGCGVIKALWALETVE